jgi:hypothetical protein
MQQAMQQHLHFCHAVKRQLWEQPHKKAAGYLHVHPARSLPGSTCGQAPHAPQPPGMLKASLLRSEWSVRLRLP